MHRRVGQLLLAARLVLVLVAEGLLLELVVEHVQRLVVAVQRGLERLLVHVAEGVPLERELLGHAVRGELSEDQCGALQIHAGVHASSAVSLESSADAMR